jgi:hypothetical protein
MLKELREQTWFQLTVGAIIGVATLAMLSWLLGLTGEICSGRHVPTNSQCHHYNLVLASLWQMGEALNWAAAAITGIATALLVYATVRLVTLGREQSKTTRAQLRAYVFIELVEFARPETDNGDNEHWYVHVVLRNFGSTPAYLTRARIEKEIGAASKPDDVTLTLTANAENHAATVIPPGHIHTIRTTGLQNGLQTYLQYRNAGNRSYVWGRIEYTDAFGEPHWLILQMLHYHGQVRQFAFCQRGNESDQPFKEG